MEPLEMRRTAMYTKKTHSVGVHNIPHMHPLPFTTLRGHFIRKGANSMDASIRFLHSLIRIFIMSLYHRRLDVRWRSLRSLFCCPLFSFVICLRGVLDGYVCFACGLLLQMPARACEILFKENGALGSENVYLTFLIIPHPMQMEIMFLIAFFLF